RRPQDSFFSLLPFTRGSNFGTIIAVSENSADLSRRDVQKAEEYTCVYAAEKEFGKTWSSRNISLSWIHGNTRDAGPRFLATIVRFISNWGWAKDNSS